MPHRTLLLPITVATTLALSPSAQTVLLRISGQQAGERLGMAVGRVGDLDNDGAPEIIAGGDNLVRVYSGRTGVVLRTLTPILPGESFGAAVDGIGDVTGDGVPDLLVGAPDGGHGTSVGAVYVFSGATGALSRTVTLSGSDRLGYRLAVLNDVNGDNVPDFVADDRGTRRLICFSGLTGGLLYSVGFGSYDPNYPEMIREAGDVNRDGVVDVVAGDARSPGVTVFSGRNGTVLRRFNATSGLFGRAVGPAGDVDGDGWPDVVAGASNEGNGVVYVISGNTGAVVRRWSLPPNLASGIIELGRKVTGIGDINNDGYADVAAACYTYPIVETERIFVFSGRDGTVLMIRPTDSRVNGSGGALGGLRDVGDLNRDGTPDFVVGLPYDQFDLPDTGLLLAVSGVPFASSTVLGASCGGGPFLPDLRSTRPILGQDATLAGLFAPANAAGLVLWSSVPARPLDLNGGCFLHLDVLTLLPLVVVPNVGTWQTAVPLPADRTFAGMPLRMQALFFPTAGFLGFDLTNGLEWRLGY